LTITICTELLGRFEPGIGQVDGDDVTGAEQKGPGNGREADGSGADDGHDVARRDAAVEDTHLVGRRQDVGQHEELVVGDPGRHRVGRRVDKRHAHLLGLGPVDVVAEDPASSFETLPEAVLAAEAASSTGRDARDQHPVARLEVPYGGPDLDVDGPDGLMAEDPAGGHLGEVALEDVQVAAADGRGVNRDDGIGGVDQCGVGYFVPALLVGTVVDERFHGMAPSRRVSSVAFCEVSD
jgi:hypothetical protein